MFLKLHEFYISNLDTVSVLFDRYRSLNKSLMLMSDLWDEFLQFCADENLPDLSSSPLGRALSKAQEAAVDGDFFYIAIRPKVAHWNYLRYCFATRELKEISVSNFLAFKEKLVMGNLQQPILEFDLEPFERDFPKMNQSRSIGHGVEFLNRVFSNKLSRNLSGGDQLIFSFLQLHGLWQPAFHDQ